MSAFDFILKYKCCPVWMVCCSMIHLHDIFARHVQTVLNKHALLNLIFDVLLQCFSFSQNFPIDFDIYKYIKFRFKSSGLHFAS